MLYIEIPMNMETGCYKKLHFGDLLSMSFVTEGGLKHYFQSEVLGYKEEGIRMIGISKPEEGQITSKQRRNYLRIPAKLEVAVDYNGVFRFVTETINVSGGELPLFMIGTRLWIKGREYLVGCWFITKTV
ncbi:flagellar brake domain-containing protein [Paenibacillus larvae]|nr:flagellar brake domain-containing protein [Paenibacillus larvae]MDT2264953.1 flagellar brake domain-containing protein [Paenibacillus larvae]MDT2275552.1 flagellar brake domain-containing protein [Paenibacillus larvae]MDT2292190.1 flagellar brake domain-containing protein [Paenibacillus larvae]